MPVTFTITQDRLLTIVAHTLGVSLDQIRIDPTEDGVGLIVTSDDSKDLIRTEALFKRWAKTEAAAASDPTAN